MSIIVARRLVAWIALAAAVGLVAVAATIAISARPSLPDPSASFTDSWPPFVMVYEAPGDAVHAGGVITRPRQVHRLTWNSPTDWYDEVVESDTIKLPADYGSLTYVGSWKSFDGVTYTEFSAPLGHTYTDKTDRAAAVSILSALMTKELARSHGLDLATAPRAAEADSVVICYRSDCASGRQAVAAGRPDDPFLFTQRGIPLRAPREMFTVLRIEIDAAAP